MLVWPCNGYNGAAAIAFGRIFLLQRQRSREARQQRKLGVVRGQSLRVTKQFGVASSAVQDIKLPSRDFFLFLIP